MIRRRHDVVGEASRRLSLRLAVLALGFATLAPVLAVGSAGSSGGIANAADGDDTSVSGTGAFSGLTVTVDRTDNLTNQTVKVSWVGGTPSKVTAGGLFLTDFLQIMQCWAEPGQLPDREQCQFGGFNRVENGAVNVASRINTQFQRDPLETEYGRPADDFVTAVAVDFLAVDGTREIGRRESVPAGFSLGQSQFFDAASTNEVPLARTRPDGTGEVFFEVQTGLEAPGLGCGQVINGRSPDCFIVVVPRNNLEVNGAVAGATLADPLRSSPLSQTNWNNRLVVPLDFTAVGASCVLGRPETPTVGSDLVSEAITRWQPALCGAGERNFGFTSLPDAQSRALLASDDPNLVFLTGAPSAPKGTVFAPVAVSALSFGVNIERQLPTNDPTGKPIPEDKVPAEIRALTGARFEQVNLTPRLIAKLLTQSYRFDVAFGTAANVGTNPFDMSTDPDFLAVNPDFTPQGYPMRFPNSIGRLLMQAGLLDSADLLWRYVLLDKDAREFLAGKADPWGMVLNERYKGLVLPTDSYPRADLGCEVPASAPPGFELENCTLDVFPYSGSLASAARQVSRGDGQRRDTPRLEPVPGFGLSGVQTTGTRSMIGLVDTPSAARYQIVNVALRNASGKFVTPTAEAMTAAVAAMTKDGKGILQPNLTASDPKAYPLTLVSYAATVPAKLTANQRADYSRLIRYAATTGQDPSLPEGGLPEGYVPLPSALRSEAEAAANAIASYKAPAPTPTATPTPEPTDSFTPAPEVPSDEPSLGTAPSAGATSPSPAPSSAEPTASPSTNPVASRGVTPADPASASRLALLAALVLGMAALLARVVLPWIGPRRT